MICEYSEKGAKEVETEVIAAPSNGESLSFCLGITLLHGGKRFAYIGYYTVVLCKESTQAYRACVN